MLLWGVMIVAFRLVVDTLIRKGHVGEGQAWRMIRGKSLSGRLKPLSSLFLLKAFFIRCYRIHTYTHTAGN